MFSSKFSKGKIGKMEKKITFQETEVHWEIPNFIGLSNNYHDSLDFKFIDFNWRLIIDPFENGSQNIILFLVGDTTIVFCNIMCTFGIKKVDGSMAGIRSFTHAFSTNKNVLKADRFFTRSALQEDPSGLLPSNTLTIVCKLKHLSHKSNSLKFKDLNTLLENIKNFSVNKELSDITLQLSGKKFQAHKLILAAQSPVFAAMFKHETSEKQTGIVNIADCDPESFEEFLKYLYSGELENISIHSAHHLYRTSDKYDIQKLKMFCLEYMAQNLKMENFFDVVVLAEEYDEKILFSAAQNFFNRNLGDIFASDEWKILFKKNFTLANKLLLEMATKLKSMETKYGKSFIDL